MAENGDIYERVLDGLTQCLHQGKRPIGLLLGAGCPASIRIPNGEAGEKPLIPDIGGLTKKVNDALSVSDFNYKALVDRLADDLGQAPNIEDILSHIRGLAAIVGKQSVHGLNASSIDDLEDAVTEQIAKAVEVCLPEDNTPYDDVAIWAQAVTRTIPIRIFTTNYDLLLETAFERNTVPFFDGFVGAKNPFLDTEAIESDDLPARWVRLLKLHGSSNWTMLPTHRVVRRQPSSSEGHRLIHPSHMKYTESRRMPYLVMLDQLRDFLKSQLATLIVVGYSFRDDHINDLLDQGLRGNPRAKVFGLLYDKLSHYDRATSLARRRPGLTAIAPDGAIDAGRQASLTTPAGGVATTNNLGDFKEFGAHLRRLVGYSGNRTQLPDMH